MNISIIGEDRVLMLWIEVQIEAFYIFEIISAFQHPGLNYHVQNWKQYLGWFIQVLLQTFRPPSKFEDLLFYVIYIFYNMNANNER